MADYARARDTATRLIARYGASCVWRQVTVAADPDTPWLPGTPVPVDHAVKIAFFTRGGQFDAFFQFVRGTDVPAGKNYGLMSVVPTFTPRLKDTIIRTVDGVIFAPRAIDPLAPAGGLPVMYTVEFTA